MTQNFKICLEVVSQTRVCVCVCLLFMCIFLLFVPVWYVCLFVFGFRVCVNMYILKDNYIDNSSKYFKRIKLNSL